VENFKILAEEKKLDFNQTRSIYLKTPLIEASENQNTPIIEYLLE
jgi:ankyrin repeat protein